MIISVGFVHDTSYRVHGYCGGLPPMTEQSSSPLQTIQGLKPIVICPKLG